VNDAVLVPVPIGVVTVILPVTAPAGTTAVILVDELTTKVAETPPNLTEVVPVKFVPLIVTEVPTGPDIGENDEIVGLAVVTVNLWALVAVPPGVVTEILPVVAPEGTTAVIFVAELTVNDVALTPLNFTDVVVNPVPLKFVPLIVTVVPTGPLVGENEEIVGAGAVVEVTVKTEELVAVPSGVVTLIGPVVAPAGTGAVIFVKPFTANVADVALNVTAVASFRSVP
jgi:hypothetical protein